eukprot:GEZU01042322.1.p2 GENE.GEZU01042322.1~~GEZU01042322.1.p2  ORF type:complete len:119 (+),score=28.60 GEZU01042322.1:56-412(+)
MRQLKSCGILLFKDKNIGAKGNAFLLMKHADRLDLPKGHMENNETEIQTAMREFEEETNLSRNDIVIDDKFRFAETYYPKYKRFGGETVEKTVVIFLAHLKDPAAASRIASSEHPGFA